MANLCGADHQTMRNLRCILAVSSRDSVSNADVLRRCGWVSIHTILTTRRLRRFGHVCRLPDNLLPKVALLSKTASGSRSRGRPNLRFQDRAQYDLRHCGILVQGKERACTERNRWRKLVHNDATKAKSKWREEGQLGQKQTRLSRTA